MQTKTVRYKTSLLLAMLFVSMGSNLRYMHNLLIDLLCDTPSSTYQTIRITGAIALWLGLALNIALGIFALLDYKRQRAANKVQRSIFERVLFVLLVICSVPLPFILSRFFIISPVYQTLGYAIGCNPVYFILFIMLVLSEKKYVKGISAKALLYKIFFQQPVDSKVILLIKKPGSMEFMLPGKFCFLDLLFCLGV